MQLKLWIETYLLYYLTRLLNGLIIFSIIIGVVYGYLDSEAKKLVEQVYSKRIFNTEGFGIYARNEKGEWVRIWGFPDAPPDLSPYEDFQDIDPLLGAI